MTAQDFLQDLRREGLLKVKPHQRADGAYDVALVLDGGYSNYADAVEVADLITSELREMTAGVEAVTPAKARLVRYANGREEYV